MRGLHPRDTHLRDIKEVYTLGIPTLGTYREVYTLGIPTLGTHLERFTP